MRSLFLAVLFLCLNLQNSFAMSVDEAENCKAVSKHTTPVFKTVSNTLSEEILEIVIGKVNEIIKESKSCDELKKKVDPIVSDLKKLLAETAKFMPELKIFSEELKKRPHLTEEELSRVNLADELIAMVANSKASESCTFNTGVSIECSEGLYKFAGSGPIDKVNHSKREILNKIDTPSTPKKDSSTGSAVKK